MTNEYTDRTCIETIDEKRYLIDLCEDTREIVFRHDDETETEIRRYSFETFADVASGLLIDIDREIVIPAGLVAMLKQWANLDPIGLRLREQG
ncbi:hypothetical protein Acy02nite_68760 [Actinoplanes cyaneus]|uniref:Uncharacterized protein n=1 Tax=Actinoplanes cyaneus TaxID=52696 RepID=A0A919IVU2_9ACTN|nr:hypothetical protein [Actinoplanes cyaneus]GID68995.1 hypothetical protein Acy02nite_68760 [Actinoplanes cyaneus]